jgi:hypothetical protein
MRILKYIHTFSDKTPPLPPFILFCHPEKVYELKIDGWGVYSTSTA